MLNGAWIRKTVALLFIAVACQEQEADEAGGGEPIVDPTVEPTADPTLDPTVDPAGQTGGTAGPVSTEIGGEPGTGAPSPPVAPGTGTVPGAQPGTGMPAAPPTVTPPAPTAPALSVAPARGFYSAPLSATITTTAPGATIRYTLNGAAPTANAGTLYQAPIAVTGTTVIRAGAFKDGLMASAVQTHTYIFVEDVVRQSPTGAPPPGWPASWGANTVDYGMDARVVDDPRYAATIRDDLKQLPTLSLVMNLPDLFDPTTGIYANPRQDTEEWERPGSLELIYPDGRAGFQINAGVRIRGGFSRDPKNPKHSFRLFFRKRYGDDKLHFPMFGPGGAQEFDKFDLRCAQNYSWSFGGDARGVFIQDQFARDTQLAMGQQGERGDFYHLYINGQYWGLYNSDERPSADFADSYWGKSAAGWDTVKVDAEAGYTIYATDGDMLAWTRLYDVLKVGVADDALMMKLQGRRPDGAADATAENLVDVDNLIDYMLLVFYTGNLDAPISQFVGGGNVSPNNFYALRDRQGTTGFRFVAHDSEHTLLDVNTNRLGPYKAGDQGVAKSNPQWVFQKLAASPAFRARIAARAEKHFFGDGAMTPAKALERFQRRRNEIDRAVVAESARWGNAKRTATQAPLGREDWLVPINRITSTYLPQRTGIVVDQLRAKGWLPADPVAASGP